tara:strand:- start:378 stop:815 length:438 start_codon:yes stop_codon:yes gene_type:complete
MESKTFVKLLRKIIREEVSKAVRSALNESTVQVSSNINLQEIEDPMPNRPIAKKKYTKNKMLNDLLNETAATPASGELADWSSMNFKSQMAQSYQQPTTNVMPLATSGIDGERVNMNNKGVAATVNAMTKDYSSLMKAIDKKKAR